MNNADLAEIRALLQASTAHEQTRKPGLAALFARPPAPGSDRRHAARPAPRRVGLRPIEDTAVLELMEPLPAPDPATEASRRPAFGQRADGAPEPLPLRLTSRLPPPEPATVPLAEAVRTNLLARRLLAAPAETPYHPEDLFDPVESDAEQVYAASGLFEPRAAAPEPEPQPEPDPERELLRHLERVFLAERAALALAA